MHVEAAACDRKTLVPSPIGPSSTFAPALPGNALVEGFYSPPDVAKPRVWWHWMNGNVTEEGVRLDFEWMRRVGIGGVTNFDAAFDLGITAFDTPVLVEKPLTYLSPGWRQVLRYSVDLANESGLEFGICSAPGYEESGGPWVKPHQAMKKLVWSETYVQGGKACKGRLAKPPETTGLFQDISSVGERCRRGVGNPEIPAFYADVRTLAYRAPASEIPLASLEPSVTSSAGAIDGTRLFDGDLARTVPLPFGGGRLAWIQFSFTKPQRFQAVTAVIGRPSSPHPLLEPAPNGWLEVSDDGRIFRKVTTLSGGGFIQSTALQQTVSFPPTVGCVFRVVLERPEPGLAEQLGLVVTPVAHQIAQLVLHTAARVNRFEDKAGYSTRQILCEDNTQDVAAADAICNSDVIDLTSRMQADGSLDWTPPAGRWIVLRFGFSLTGRTNHPASRAATGLEVDKLSRKHVETYIDTYLAEYEKTLGAELVGQRGLQYVVTDSYEAGPQNWTDDMLEQFRQRRGYNAIPWLPVLAGRVVESAVASDRFLWDFRKTIGDLMAEAHYGQFSASLHQRGLGRYGESHEVGRAFLGDGMEVKKTADIPMGALWAVRPPGVSQENYDADIRESASVAHIYGRNLVAGESFTALGNTYGFAPETLKPIADRALAMGLNRFVIHASVHQPDSKPGPGIGLGPFGQWFTRKETWAGQADSWVQYLTRSSYLLQQGRFVADLAYLYGEETNVTALFHSTAVPVPEGYNFDFVNPDALLNELSVRAGKLVTRSGMEYRMLALDTSTQCVSVLVLRKIRDLVRAGAVVVGAKPTGTPSLADDEDEFRAIVMDLWGKTPSARTVGSGKVFADRSLAQALLEMHILPDVIFTKSPNAEMRFVHRALEGGDLYFISSGTAHSQEVEVSFRVSGQIPELWRADIGTVTPLSYHTEIGRTIVPLKLEPNDAVFVVFRYPTRAQSVVIQEPTTEVLATVEGPWEVSFPPSLGAPAHVSFDRLYSWTDSADVGVKYFSGTATYEKTLPMIREWLEEGSRVQLDLGAVKNLAEVAVNGLTIGVVWKAPFKLDLTEALKVGENRIEIKVTNLWPNRLIGDKQLGARKIAFATFDPFRADSPLLPSGLLGPVTLLRVSAPRDDT
jgi:alpha-L-rhamnosidase/Glycosyl hydrolases family 2, sugar binding domain